MPPAPRERLGFCDRSFVSATRSRAIRASTSGRERAVVRPDARVATMRRPPRPTTRGFGRRSPTSGLRATPVLPPVLPDKKCPVAQPRSAPSPGPELLAPAPVAESRAHVDAGPASRTRAAVHDVPRRASPRSSSLLARASAGAVAVSTAPRLRGDQPQKIPYRSRFARRMSRRAMLLALARAHDARRRSGRSQDPRDETARGRRDNDRNAARHRGVQTTRRVRS